jgi:cation diffusion facilitator CzcD-associated flavoprotein CzcO
MTKDRQRAGDPSPRSDLRFNIIGAGMSGLLAAIRLREAGFDDFVVYEKGDGVGGTWRENTYPGIACDVPSHFYSYSFALNPDWSPRFSPGHEIRAYFEDVAQRYELLPSIRFGTEVERCAFDDGRWRLTLSDGSRDQADFVIAATGLLHHPALPGFEGLDTFEGTAFHSARWSNEISLEGKRDGVVGTGSSAVQIVAAIADEVSSLSLFQRTPQWITPVDNPAYSDAERERFREQPVAILGLRDQISNAFMQGFANAMVDAYSPILTAIHQT